MKEIQKIPSRDLCIWLASKSTGTMLHVGCKLGYAAAKWGAWAHALRLKRRDSGTRRVVAMDWSGEHRIDSRQRVTPVKYELGIAAARVEGVQIVNQDPGLYPFDQFQPLGFALIDYDYSLASLRRVSEPILAAAPVLANPNVVVAWGGYEEERRSPAPEYPCQVRYYVNSLELGDTYSVQGGNMAFKVYNMTPDFREELKELAAI